MAEFGLQLSRRLKEQVVCEFLPARNPDGDGDGDDATPVRLVVTVMEIRGNRVKLAFNAPPSVDINRSERLDSGAASSEGVVLALNPPSQQVEVERDEILPAGCVA